LGEGWRGGLLKVGGDESGNSRESSRSSQAGTVFALGGKGGNREVQSQRRQCASIEEKEEREGGDGAGVTGEEWGGFKERTL